MGLMLLLEGVCLECALTWVLAIRMIRPSLKVTVVCTALLALGGGKNAYGSAAGCSAAVTRASAGSAAAAAP